MKRIKVIVVTFLISLVAFWLQVTTIGDALYEFHLVSSKPSYLLSLCIGLLPAIICAVITNYLLNTTRYTRIENWLSRNISTLLLVYILTNVFCISIKSTLVWSYAKIKELLALEWTILGISIAIFLIWNVIAIDYLDKKKPQCPADSSQLSTAMYIKKKSDFALEAKLLLSNINLLLVNVLFLLITTILIYIGSSDATVLGQNAVLIALLLCTNTISGLFLDIYKFYFAKKKKLLDENKVTNADITLQNQILNNVEEALTACRAIEKLSGVSDEEKIKLKTKILSPFLGDFSEDHSVQK